MRFFLLCWRAFRYIKTNYSLFYAPVGWEIPLKLGWELMPVGNFFFYCVRRKEQAASSGELCPHIFLNNLRDGDSSPSLGRLFQCLTTPKVKIFFFLKSNLNILWPNSRLFFPCPISTLGSTDRAQHQPEGIAFVLREPQKRDFGFAEYFQGLNANYYY